MRTCVEGGAELTATEGNLEAELIDVLRARVLESMPSAQVPACMEFVRQYYHWVPAEDLADRSEGDLYGAAISHWTAARRRGPGQSKVRVYNPDAERDGWHSPHTVIEIVCDDMPFIVDSVTMELSRQGHPIELLIHPVIRVRRDHRGELIGLLEPGALGSEAIAESVIHAEVTREPDRDKLAALLVAIERVLGQVRAVVQDWEPMRERARTLAQITYAENNLSGAFQSVELNQNAAIWKSVIPGTQGENNLHFACVDQQ